MTRPTCWGMTTGEPGMRSQVLGLAERIDCVFVEKRVSLLAPWRWLPGHWAVGALNGLGKESDPLHSPWPDILITCGRRSVAVSIAIRKASAGKTFTVHIQDPRVPPHYFDLVTCPEHDRLSGSNVYPTQGAIHKVTPEKLQAARDDHSSVMSQLSRPRVAVLIGGNSKSYQLDTETSLRLADQLQQLSERGASLAVTFSARTGSENEAIIRDRLKTTSAFIWDGTGDNPYFSMLAQSDHLLVTEDSASMVTEAVSSGKPVMTIPLKGGSTKFERFHKMMQEAGYTRPFLGTLEDWSYDPLDETQRIAQIVTEHWRSRSTNL